MKRLELAEAILDEARTFFEDRGSHGFEGTAMIAFNAADGGTRLVIPTQAATPAPWCSVEVTMKGKLELAAALGPDERYLSRIHSHPADAFHSPADDANPAITFVGALSIVVPYFGLGLRRGLDACAVLVRERGEWREVPVGPNRDRLVVVS